MKAFVQRIANMSQDGEEIDGVEFVMENDDAVETLNDLISLARELVTVKKPVKKAKVERLLCYINAYGKPVYFSVNMTKLILARRAGKIKAVYDWLPAYRANVGKAQDIQSRIDTPRPAWEEGDTSETRQAKQYQHDQITEKAKRDMAALKRKIFNTGKGTTNARKRIEKVTPW